MSPNIKVALFSAQKYDREYFDSATQHLPMQVEYFESSLSHKTVALARGFDVVCVFVNDELQSNVIQQLDEMNVRMIALRCAGFNNVDLEACREHGLPVVRVPEYSPFAVAEHTFGLILTLNRKIHKAFNRVREGNFSLEGLLGFDLNKKTIGVIGCGNIGSRVARIAHGFGMDVLLVDPNPNTELEAFGDFTDLEAALEESDIVSLHCPLNDSTFHLINDESLDRMKIGAMLVNTSRGGLIETHSVIQRLKSGQLGSLAIDVYEEEAGLFFRDRSATVLKDDVFARLLTFPNVLITGHQAFFTHEALKEIAETTVSSILSMSKGEPLEFQVGEKPALSQ